jgi:hypothetical protein
MTNRVYVATKIFPEPLPVYEIIHIYIINQTLLYVILEYSEYQVHGTCSPVQLYQVYNCTEYSEYDKFGTDAPTRVVNSTCPEPSTQQHTTGTPSSKWYIFIVPGTIVPDTVEGKRKNACTLHIRISLTHILGFTLLPVVLTMRFRLTGSLLLLLLQLTEGHRVARVSSPTISSRNPVVLERRPFIVVRGGAEVDDEDDSLAEGDDVDSADEEDIEDEAEEKEEEKKLDPKLTKSAMLSTTKVQSKKAAATKEAMSATLKVKKSTKKGSFMKALQLPYFVRACMNPFTVLAMTRAYFASLFNLNYLKEKVRIYPILVLSNDDLDMTRRI